KQALLVDKIVQTLGMQTGEFSGAEFHSLGAMSTFVSDEIFVQISRPFLVENIEYVRRFCFGKSKRELVGRILQDPLTFGSVLNWTAGTLDQVDRLIFFLNKSSLQQIPPVRQMLMTQERIERLFLSQWQWERSEFGAPCQRRMGASERKEIFQSQQFLLQLFLGFLKTGKLSQASATLVPSCESVRNTLPSAWSVDSLVAMTADAFASCLELIGQDPFFTPYELSLLLNRVKQISGSASSFSPALIAQLGHMALRLTQDELKHLSLTELSAVFALGRISTWSPIQLSVLFGSVLNSTKLTPTQLDSSMLVSLGYIMCGIKTSDLTVLNPVEFSKAVLWLGQMELPCSEPQLASMVGLLSHPMAFGPISSWGPEVFIEIGSVAAGIPDMAMSSLVKEQIEGITPLAISLIPPDKFAVVFSQDQIRMFSYEQASAVTAGQQAGLSGVQQTALSMVLTPWEDTIVDFRGRSAGLLLRPTHPMFLLGLMLLLL
ncbi:STRC protein, partial [Amia calva]|nr:STRC protein [Amia calva]